MQTSVVFVSPQHEVGSQQVFTARQTAGIGISWLHAGRTQTGSGCSFLTGGTQTCRHVSQCVQTRSVTVVYWPPQGSGQGAGAHGDEQGAGAAQGSTQWQSSFPLVAAAYSFHGESSPQAAQGLFPE